jgi:hypothetical protein
MDADALQAASAQDFKSMFFRGIPQKQISQRVTQGPPRSRVAPVPVVFIILFILLLLPSQMIALGRTGLNTRFVAACAFILIL